MLPTTSRIVRRALLITTILLALVLPATAAAAPAPSASTAAPALPAAAVAAPALSASAAAPALPVWDADRAGPALRVPAAALARSLVCSGDLRSSTRDPILLIPGTTLTPEVNFSWNYERAFTQRGRPWCAVTLPNNAMGDIQVSAEYVVSALRTMADRSGKRVQIVGFSQGGMIGRWALKYWPDTRATTSKVIGIDPSNHGTLDAYPVCAPGCAPALWQQQTGSRFLAALNDGPETFAGISYTSIHTPLDEVVVPNLPPAPSSALNTGAGARRNISTFEVCPGHVAEHLSMGSFDAVGYGLVTDALDHAAPADPARVDRAVCLQAFHEGVDPVTFPADLARYTATAATVVATAARVTAEPPLMAYAAGD